jgi:hypothetical protein
MIPPIRIHFYIVMLFLENRYLHYQNGIVILDCLRGNVGPVRVALYIWARVLAYAQSSNTNVLQTLYLIINRMLSSQPKRFHGYWQMGAINNGFR